MKSPARCIWRVAPFGLLLASALFGAVPHINPDSYEKEVRYLASPELKGRATGSPELEQAASQIASLFKSFGLQPVDGKNFEIPFPAEIGAKLGPNNTFTFEEAGKKFTLKEGADFVPFSMSTSGKLSAPVVFAGFGITAKEQNYDDYAGIDVKDKLVLILRHEPQEHDDKSPFSGKRLTSHATFTDKMANAKAHGARGVILINDIAAHGDQDKLEELGSTGGPRDAKIFFVQVKAAVAERWLEAEGHTIKELSQAIDRDLKPHSFALTKLNVDLSVDLIRETKIVHNVAGYLPGTTPEYIVIGAHYDHLGLGGEFSLAPNMKGTIHPGADDNASGTAGVIELARYLSQQPKQKRGFLFLTFAGEELGLLGSSWYVNHPVLPLENAVAMINLDMIGRIRNGRVFVSGAQTGTTLEAALRQVDVPAPLRLDESGRNSGTNMNDASDHASFVSKQIPSLFFFSGLHGDYHKPSDTADKINAADAAKLLDYVAEVATVLASAPDRPGFTKPAPEPRAQRQGRASQSGYGPDFGSIPDFNEPPRGVRFADIRAGSPADKAGLKAGDILVEFDGKAIDNLYDFTYALREHKPGDEVPVKVLRDGQTIEAKVLLTERR